MSSAPTIILVGDVVENREAALATRSFDADKPTRADIEVLCGWLDVAGYAWNLYDSVRSFVDEVPEDTAGTLVLPLWRGGPSRNRTAIVPAVCEERDIPFIGGDVFVQTVAQDKSLSKVFARNAGFAVPAEWLLPHEADLASFKPLRRLRPPFVVKPQYSAASIGIEERSLCSSDEQGCAWARELFSRGLGPVVCEEFIEGDEISLCFIEERGNLVATCVAAVLDESGRFPYRNRLVTFDEKACDDDGTAMCAWPGEIDPALWDCSASLVRLLGKTDMMRIDGRLSEGTFTVIELTQDPHLGINSELVGGFNASGLPPPSFLDLLIKASLRNQAS